MKKNRLPPTMRVTRIIKDPDNYKPTLGERIDDVLPWWIPRLKVNVYLDLWSGMGLAFLIVLMIIGFILAII